MVWTCSSAPSASSTRPGRSARWRTHGVLGLSWYEWLSGPSVALCTLIILAVWTTSGTFMLIFLAALQDIPEELEEAAALDGVNRRQMLRGTSSFPPCGPWSSSSSPSA